MSVGAGSDGRRAVIRDAEASEARDTNAGDGSSGDEGEPESEVSGKGYSKGEEFVSKGVPMMSDEGEWKLRCSIEGIGRDDEDGVESNESCKGSDDGGWIIRGWQGYDMLTR